MRFVLIFLVCLMWSIGMIVMNEQEKEIAILELKLKMCEENKV